MALVEDYVRNAAIVRVTDGDTFSAMIDCGFRIWIKQTIRVLGIDTPEIKGLTREAGEKAKRFAQAWFDEGPFQVKTYLDKMDSFGRVLAEVWRGEESLGVKLVESGNAITYRG